VRSGFAQLGCGVFRGTHGSWQRAVPRATVSAQTISCSAARPR
jgi:hypothetical protein